MLLGGIALGLGSIVPLATLIRWFPDRRGMITALAVAGFGAGALVTAPVAQRLIVSVGDFTGRRQVFVTMFLIQAAAFLRLSRLLVRPLEGARSALVPPYRSLAMGRNA